MKDKYWKLVAGCALGIISMIIFHKYIIIVVAGLLGIMSVSVAALLVMDALSHDASN